MEWGAVIGALLTALVPLIQYWISGVPSRAEEKRNASIDKGREAIVSKDISSIESRIDVVLTDNQTSNNDPKPSAEDVERRLGQL